MKCLGQSEAPEFCRRGQKTAIGHSGLPHGAIAHLRSRILYWQTEKDAKVSWRCKFRAVLIKVYLRVFRKPFLGSIKTVGSLFLQNLRRLDDDGVRHAQPRQPPQKAGGNPPPAEKPPAFTASPILHTFITVSRAIACALPRSLVFSERRPKNGVCRIARKIVIHKIIVTARQKHIIWALILTLTSTGFLSYSPDLSRAFTPG